MGIRKKRKQPPKRSTSSVLPNTEVQPKRRGRPPKKAKITKVEEKEEPAIPDTVQSSPEERLKCSICLDTSRCKKMKVLPCCHDFHEKCINRWFEVDIKCPLCRTWYLENVDGLVS